MPAPLPITTFFAKSHDEPDQILSPDKTRIEIANHGDFAVARFTFAPGWKWSECIKPMAGTESCQMAHLGYALSGTLVVRRNDGVENRITAGHSYTIPPGHNAWVEGDEPFVSVEVMHA